jgi:hypothetical protein
MLSGMEELGKKNSTFGEELWDSLVRVWHPSRLTVVVTDNTAMHREQEAREAREV